MVIPNNDFQTFPLATCKTTAFVRTSRNYIDFRRKTAHLDCQILLQSVPWDLQTRRFGASFRPKWRRRLIFWTLGVHFIAEFLCGRPEIFAIRKHKTIGEENKLRKKQGCHTTEAAASATTSYKFKALINKMSTSSSTRASATSPPTGPSRALLARSPLNSSLLRSPLSNSLLRGPSTHSRFQSRFFIWAEPPPTWPSASWCIPRRSLRSPDKTLNLTSRPELCSLSATSDPDIRTQTRPCCRARPPQQWPPSQVRLQLRAAAERLRAPGQVRRR